LFTQPFSDVARMDLRRTQNIHEAAGSFLYAEDLKVHQNIITCIFLSGVGLEEQGTFWVKSPMLNCLFISVMLKCNVRYALQLIPLAL
jgi:hypothetical protein